MATGSEYQQSARRLWGRLGGWIWILFVGFFTWLMARIVWPYHSGRLDIDFLLSKQHIVYALHYQAAFYLHIFPALLVLAAGLTQFSKRLLALCPGLHRWIGRAYVYSILFVCGPAGFVMAWYSNGGWVARSSFLTLSVVWWIATWIGWRAMRRGDRRRHRAWMIRSYALTLSAVSLRLMQFFFVSQTHLEVETAYRLVAWPSWLINWLIAELILSAEK